MSQLSLGGEADTGQAEAASVDVDYEEVEEEENVEEEDEEEYEPEEEEEVDVDEADKANVEKDSNNIATVEMTNLFGLLPRPSTTTKPAPTPTDFEMTTEGLPPGWAMQLMKSGRTLFIDNRNQVINDSNQFCLYAESQKQIAANHRNWLSKSN